MTVEVGIGGCLSCMSAVLPAAYSLPALCAAQGDCVALQMVLSNSPSSSPIFQSTYDLLKRVVAAIPEGPQHLVVMSGIPVIFPKVRIMSPALPASACTACAHTACVESRSAVLDQLLSNLRADPWIGVAS